MKFATVIAAVLLTVPALAFNEHPQTHHDEGSPIRYDYKLAFKKPYFFPNNSQTIPYFTTSPSVIKTPDFVRLTSSVPNQKGFIYGESKNTHPEWEIEFSFNALGRGYAGGKGIAFWYTENKLTEGDLFGVKDLNKGLGIFFNTADTEENRFTPFIYGALNDGYTSHAARRDYDKFTIGSCFRDYRNTPTPVWVRVIYNAKKLKVEMDLRQDGYSYTECFSKDNVELPTGYYFGISSATEALGDDHDIISFEGYELNPKPKANPNRPHEKEHKDKNDEFKLTEDLKHKIDAAQAKIDAIRDENKKKAPDGGVMGSMIQKLEENQFHIIEALNLVHQKLDLAPVSHGSTAGIHPEAAKSGDIHELRRELKLLTEDVQQLTSIMHEALSKIITHDTVEGSDLHHYVETHFANIHHKLEESTRKLDKMHANAADSATQVHHYGFYFVFALLGAGLVLCFIRLRNYESQPKKYF